MMLITLWGYGNIGDMESLEILGIWEKTNSDNLLVKPLHHCFIGIQANPPRPKNPYKKGSNKNMMIEVQTYEDDYPLVN